MDYQGFTQALAAETLPVAWLDIDALDRNANAILARAAGKPVRLVSKSLRNLEVIQHLLRRHAGFQGVMCFHPGEACWLSEQGLDDLLVAYPSLQASLLDAVVAQVAQGKRIVLMVDSVAHVDAIVASVTRWQQRQGSDLSAPGSLVQPLCLDLDLSTPLPGLHFGVHRSPVNSVKSALALYEYIAVQPCLKLVGVMGYEAQIAGVADNLPHNPLHNLAVTQLKAWSRRRVRARRQVVVSALRQAGADLEFVNGGGTGSMEFTVADASVSEVAVGSGFYGSHYFDYFRQFRHEPAAGFALEVCRQSASGYLTCAGGGYIASGGVGPEKLPQPWLPEGLELDSLEGAGEVQTPLKGPATQGLHPGAPVMFRHAKAGELCERFNELLWIQGDKVMHRSLTYRGEGKVFL